MGQPTEADISITDLTVSVQIQTSIVQLKSPEIYIKDRTNLVPAITNGPARVRVEPKDTQFHYFVNYVANSLVNTAVFDGEEVAADIQVFGFKSEYSKEVSVLIRKFYLFIMFHQVITCYVG